MLTRTLDARSMEHPRPLEEAVAILRDLPDDGVLVMIHHREPFPLYQIAATLGMRHTCEREEDRYVIRFSKASE